MPSRCARIGRISDALACLPRLCPVSSLAINRPHRLKFMLSTSNQHAPILSVASFRAWLASRPDEEHWELIEGVPMMMMTPPNRGHQRIASNLEGLSNSALKRQNPSLTAYHDIGVNILSTV